MTNALKILLLSVCATAAVHGQTTDLPRVKLEIKLFEIPARENRTLGFDWFLGNTSAPADGKTPGPGASPEPMTSPTPFEDGKKPVGTLSGILTDPQFKTVSRTLEARSDAKVLASPQGTTLSGSALRLHRPDGWEIQVAPTVNTNGGRIAMTVSLKQDKGDYAGFELSSSTQVRSGEAAVFGDTFATKDKKNPHKKLLLMVTPTIEPEN